MSERYDCLFRVHEKGEIFKSELDATSGLISGVPESMFSLDIKDYPRNQPDYAYYRAPRLSEYAMYLTLNPNALVVFTYNNVAAIVVDRQASHMMMYATQSCARTLYMKKEPFAGSTNVVGLVKTKLFLLHQVQPHAYLVDKSDGKCLIQVDGLLLWVSIDYNGYTLSDAVTLANYQQMVADNTCYGMVSTTEGSVLVDYDGSKLVCRR